MAKNKFLNQKFVIDPKTFSTRLLYKKPDINFHHNYFNDILDDTNTAFVKFFVLIKKLSENWFTHVFLLLSLIIYALIGGFIFSNIEGNHEKEQNEIIKKLYEPIDKLSDEIIQELWRYRQRFPLPPTINDDVDDDLNDDLNNKNNYQIPIMDQYWFRKVEDELDRLDWFVHEQCKQRLNYSIERFDITNRWDFISSVFFSMTVFTTIGYGDSPPVTTLGKTATMIYSFFGIPLLLIVLADYGRLLTKIIKYLIMSCRRIYYDRSLRSVRHMSRKATRTAKLQQSIMDAFSKMQRQPPFYINPTTGQVTLLSPSQQQQISLQQQQLNNLSNNKSSVYYKPNQSPMMNIRKKSTPSTITSPETPMPIMLDFDEMDDEFNLPISLALSILLLYLFLGAILFWVFEQWTLFHSFYFVFISMSTIGFGDFVPTKFNVLLSAFIYFLFGLALTSMCINVIQEKLSTTFEKARITIGESIGLDPTTPITIINSDVPPLPSTSSQQQQKQSK